MRTFIYISAIAALAFSLMTSTSRAQVPSDCNIPDSTVLDIRQMFTALDNLNFDIWTQDEVVCACIEIYYNDPVVDEFHDRVVQSAVIRLGKTADPRAVPVLIDAIDTHGPQALYALGNFPTVEALSALTANVRNEDPTLRENAAEGLRHMPVPDETPDGWQDAVQAAIDEIESWMPDETEPDIGEYFIDALINLNALLETSSATS